MPRKKMHNDTKIKFRNVALIDEDHALLSKLAASEQRSMARQLSVLIRRLAVKMALT